jgi:hypothetical protein
MGIVLGPEKMNDTRGKTMDTVAMVRGFTVIFQSPLSTVSTLSSSDSK